MKSKTLIIILAVFVLLLNNCKKDMSNRTYISDNQKLITSYLESNDSLTLIAALLKRSGRDIVLNTYGNYTFFAPTDKAIRSYLAANNKSKIEDMTDAEVNNLINYHILTQKVNLRAMNLGLVKDSTVNGLHILYLLKGSNIILNKVAMVENTVEVTNGYVYILDAVLDPPADNIYDYLVKTGKFTIMTQVFDQTGLKDTLQSVTIENPYTDLNYLITVSLTLFVESDDVLKSKGIASFEALKQSVWDNSKSWATDLDEALSAFARYHLFPGQKFLFQMFPNDGVNEENLITLALNRSKVIHTNGFFDQLPRLNADTASGNVVGGVSFNDALSDKIVKNGVIQQIDDVLYIPSQTPRAVYLIRECEHGTRYISSLGSGYVLQDTRISNGTLYIMENPQFTTDQLDYFGIPLAVEFTPQDVGDYIEFDIKNVPPGKYLIMLNYQRDQVNASRNVNVYFRKSSEPFNYKSIPMYAGLNMANVLNTAPVDKDFRQNKLLTPQNQPLVISSYADYTIRFVHMDIYYGTYDSFILKPVN
jgi:uncharacterized surface protein with fasciclin (FAS1) repeats